MVSEAFSDSLQDVAVTVVMEIAVETFLMVSFVPIVSSSTLLE